MMKWNIMKALTRSNCQQTIVIFTNDKPNDIQIMEVDKRQNNFMGRRDQGTAFVWLKRLTRELLHNR
jgi:hypothetical protein